MAEVYDVQINIVNPTYASDGEGHKTLTGETFIAQNLTARRQFHSAASIRRLQDGPGVRTEYLRLFVIFQKPYPAVEVGHRVDVIGAESYNVIGVRPYEGNLQLDTQEFVS
jgi:hypothetical protein